jgi:hypothetical protein
MHKARQWHDAVALCRHPAVGPPSLPSARTADSTAPLGSERRGCRQGPRIFTSPKTRGESARMHTCMRPLDIPCSAALPISNFQGGVSGRHGRFPQVPTGGKVRESRDDGIEPVKFRRRIISLAGDGFPKRENGIFEVL